jgi:hypothetical protein
VIFLTVEVFFGVDAFEADFLGVKFLVFFFFGTSYE